MSRLPSLRRGFSLIELMIVLAIIGILVTIAIPSFLRFRSRAQQSEAKSNLRAIYVAQKAYFGEKGRYSSDFRAISFAPEAGNRYSYGLGPGLLCSRAMAVGAREADCIGQDAHRFANPPSTVAASVSEDALEANEFVATAVGNVDGDVHADVWVVTSQTSLSLEEPCGTDTTLATSGAPTSAYNDVSCP